MSSKISRDRSESRRAAVARLRLEGRPVGPPKMGSKHRGPRGERYVVPDPEAAEIMEQVVHARDVLRLSWWKVSDHVDRYLAEKYSRSRTLRCNRTTWTAGMCRERYLRHKSFDGDQSPRATHRRCSVCKQTKPIGEFSRCGRYRRRVCKQCRVIGFFKKLEADKRRVFVGCLRKLSRLAKLGRLGSLEAEETWGKMAELFITTDTIATEWYEFVTSTARERPGSRGALNQLQLIVAILRQAEKEHSGSNGRRRDTNRIAKRERRKPVKPFDPAALTDEELRAGIQAYRKKNMT
jgi:hypothetical protein